MDNEKVGLFIASLRKEKSLTQKELGDKIGVTDRAVSRWERGKGCPDISLLDDLSKALDISVLEILKGRRLDNNKLIENKELIETMTYAAENLKKRVRKIFNNVVISIIIFFILLLTFFNIRSMYFLNKTYKSSIDESSYTGLFDNHKKNLNLIKNNQGIYTDEEYKNILEYIDAIDQFSDIEFAKDMLNKESYTYTDIVTVVSKLGLYQIYGYNVSITNPVFNIIVKYDLNKLGHLHIFQQFQQNYMDALDDLSNIKQLPFRNDSKITVIAGNTIKQALISQYYTYKIALEDLIEVGDIHE